MNHLKIYNDIIQKASLEDRVKLKKDDVNYVYYEKHHIIPKCLGGTNEKENLVLLTAREHFICHKLLTYIHKGNREIAYAYHYMVFGKNIKKQINISSRDYAYARKIRKNISLSINTKNKISLKISGEKNGMYGKGEKIKGGKNGMYSKTHSPETKLKLKNRIYSEEHKIKISESKKGKPLSEEHKRKISETSKGRKVSEVGKANIRNAKIGSKNPMYGKKNTWARANKHKQCEYCKLTTNLGNYNRWHGKNCKNKNI